MRVFSGKPKEFWQIASDFFVIVKLCLLFAFRKSKAHGSVERNEQWAFECD